MGYSLALIIHLFCAIIFIGFVFTDNMVLPVMKKVLSEKKYQEVMKAISSRARQIFPLSLLILILSGGFMFSSYVNSEAGIFNSNLQILLMIKVILALFIASGVVYTLSMKFLKKQTHLIMKHFHKFVLINGIIIIILAKLMFVV